RRRGIVRAEAAYVFEDVVPTQDAIISRNGARQAARKPGHHGQFPIENMGTRFANDLLSMLSVNLDRDGVAHGSGGHKQGRFFAENLRRTLFQAVYRRILAVDIVPNLSLGHGPAHLSGRPRDGVASQIDYL